MIFFSLHIDAGDGLKELSEDDIDAGIYRLRLVGAGVNLIDYPEDVVLENGISKGACNAYLKGFNIAEVLRDADVVSAFPNGAVLSPKMFKLIRANTGRGVVLLEGAKIGDGVLSLYLDFPGGTCEVGNIDLSISKVEDMFRHVTLCDVSKGRMANTNRTWQRDSSLER